MRLRAFVVGLVAVVSIGVGAPAAQAARAKPVSGTFDGTGSLVIPSGCPFVLYESYGTYSAKRLGQGTYALNFCVDGSLNAQGTFDLTTGRGAQLHGTIDEYLADALNAIHVTVTGGTKQFAGATGSLVLSITQHDQTNCDPRVNVCFNWQEHGTIAGSIRLHRHHR